MYNVCVCMHLIRAVHIDATAVCVHVSEVFLSSLLLLLIIIIILLFILLTIYRQHFVFHTVQC